jgi:hypothetical protein
MEETSTDGAGEGFGLRVMMGSALKRVVGSLDHTLCP